MKAFLMYPNRDFDLQRKLPSNEQALMQDLELDALFNAMALGDKFLADVAKSAVLSGLRDDLDTIRYRQRVLQDCLKNPAVVREIYDVAVKSIEKEKKVYYGILGRHADSILYRSIEALQMFVGMLRKLRSIADEHGERFESEGFRTFFAMLQQELGDDYFASIQDHLRELKLRNGALISAELGAGNRGTSYTLRKSQVKLSWMERIFAKKPPEYTIYITDRDDNGARALSEIRERGINLVANALAQSADHILSFFSMLRTELAFYVGCLNLQGRLAALGAPIVFPQPAALDERRHSFTGLYDVCLALALGQNIVGNDLTADARHLVIITGANQGGKSTFLRSIGLSQLMMQCGMFVPAEFYCANVCDGLFTHYRREEDATMKSGKLDEELSRMSDIIDNITLGSIVLFNESFAATNEREGSEIAGQIIHALLEKRIKVFFVTHLYEFAHGFYERRLDAAMFLRAERQADGGRTFRVIEAEPLQTSYGADLYKAVFQTGNTS